MVGTWRIWNEVWFGYENTFGMRKCGLISGFCFYPVFFLCGPDSIRGYYFLQSWVKKEEKKESWGHTLWSALLWALVSRHLGILSLRKGPDDKTISAWAVVSSPNANTRFYSWADWGAPSSRYWGEQWWGFVLMSKKMGPSENVNTVNLA